MHNKTFRLVFLLLVALIIAALAVGCGAPSVEPPAEKEQAPAEVDAVPDEAAEPTSLDFVVWSYGLETIQDNIKNYQEANPECEINLRDYSWLDYHDTMVGRFAAGDPPPLLYGSDHWLQEWAAAEWLAPIDASFPQVLEYSDELGPYALQGMTYNDNVYGLSYYADTIDFVYNEEHLKEAGFDSPPESWQDVWDMSMALKEQGIAEYPMILAFSQQEGASIEAMISMIYGRHVGDGALFDANNQPTFAEEGSAAYKAVEWLAEAYEAGVLDPASLATAEIDQVKSMQSGAHTFTILPQYNMAELNRPDSGEYSGSFRIALMPGDSHSTVGYVRFYAMTPGVEAMGEAAMECAWKFLDYFGGKTDGTYTVVKRWAVENGLGFAQLPLFEDPDVREAFGSWGDVDVIAAQAELARAKEGLTPWFGTWDVFTRAEVHKAILGQQDTMTSLNNMAEKWNELAEQ
ncbi:MAG: ABC transporter substrate-binding protein [Anaerolineales bacterium]|nr:ABC transporter substrate-binding protein [Anaerolineales bacterium]